MEKWTKLTLPILSFLGSLLLFWYLGRHELKTTELFGILLTLAGYALWFVGRYYLGKAYSLLPQAKYIVSRGPYSIIRHPLYLAQMMVLGGVIIFISDHLLWILFFLVLLFQLHRINREEEILLQTFEVEYDNYRNTTWF